MPRIIKYLTSFSNLIHNRKATVYVIRTLIVMLLAVYCYYGYLLGWTNHFRPKHSSGSAWSKRLEYIDKGIHSIVHLNIVSVALGTSIIVLPSVMLLLLLKTRTLLNRNVNIFLIYATLFVLTENTVLRLDVPFNYYASRYFLPILIPLLYILFATIMDGLNRRILIIPVIAVILLFNVPYVYNLYTHPLYQDNFSVVDSINRYIPKDSYVFLIGNEDLRNYLQLSLRYTNNSKVIYIDNKGISVEKLDDRLKGYAHALGIKTAYCITEDMSIPESISQCLIIKRVNNYYDESTVIYPHRTYTNEHTYYIFNKEIDHRSILLYPHSEWLVDGDLSIGSFYEIQSDDKYLMIESAGDWKEHFRNNLNNLNLRTYINGVELILKKEENNSLYFLLPEGVKTIESIRISSSTFNPQELGINNDSRNLGIDIKSIIVSNRQFNRKNILMYPDSQWLVNGDISLRLLTDIEDGNKFIVIESSGKWKPRFGKDSTNLNLKIYINEVELKLEKEKDNKFYFWLPRGVTTIEEVRITSSTFNPKKLGINDDSRNLGIDIKSVEIE
jgi:hypothetical protein